MAVERAFQQRGAGARKANEEQRIPRQAADERRAPVIRRAPRQLFVQSCETVAGRKAAETHREDLLRARMLGRERSHRFVASA